MVWQRPVHPSKAECEQRGRTARQLAVRRLRASSLPQPGQRLCLFTVTRVFHSHFALGENTTFRRGDCVIGIVFQSLLRAPFLFTFLLFILACHLSCKISIVFCRTEPGSRKTTSERPRGTSSLIINCWRNQQVFCIGIRHEMGILPFDFRE